VLTGPARFSRTTRDRKVSWMPRAEAMSVGHSLLRIRLFYA
jgi:hypothetical protein